MKGKVIKYEQDNIDTDVILPGPYLKLHEHSELAEHAMEGMDPEFHSKVKNANIIVLERILAVVLQGNMRQLPLALVESKQY